ncbi:MAG: hypothetical protein B7733_05500 [Myxococcales bacterium FL481]|nr:MAG: hypothetical protein B7733_05500 [Myxococcales bacterium FL481]
MLALAAGVAGLGPSCAHPEDGARTRPRRIHDKASVFGDPALVPTRRGERIRLELALAGEIERIVANDPHVTQVAASVRIPAADRPAAAVVSVQARPMEPAERRALAQDARRVIHRVVPDSTADTVDVAVHVAPEPPTPVAFPWALATALIGLGWSCGVAVDRWRSRRRPLRSAHSRQSSRLPMPRND